MRMPENPLLDEVVLYSDGASRGNPGDAAISYRLKANDGTVIVEHAEPIGRSTNNEAEYRAHIAGLEACERHTRRRVSCHSDSLLMIMQLRGEHKVKAATLRRLWERAQTSARRFEEVVYTHVPRADPNIALVDKLANQALDAPAV